LNQKRTWHRFPSLDDSVANLKLKKSELTEAKKVIERIEKLLQKILEAKLEIAEFNKISHLLVSGKANVRGAPPRIAVENWKDAETLALLYVKWLGFQDAKKSKAGSDEGKDVESSKCVAQVKDMGTGATREMVQRLFGVASAEKKTPIFFSRTYAKTAVDWANTHNIALFSFNIRGVVTPVTEKAKQLTLR
jgi:hypothetical protein